MELDLFDNEDLNKEVKTVQNNVFDGFTDFKNRFKLLATKNQYLVVNTLSNIFTMRLIGNKTHGDLAEIGIVEFINQFMYDFQSIHVGKDLFRAKEHEEDIVIKSMEIDYGKEIIINSKITLKKYWYFKVSLKFFIAFILLFIICAYLLYKYKIKK